ncbi:hypothetical protein ACFQZQ_13725, partial [Lysobacter koreensis]
ITIGAYTRRWVTSRPSNSSANAPNQRVSTLSKEVPVPFLFLFRRLGWLKLWQVVPMSAAMGGAISVALGFGHISAINTLQLVGYGALTGLVFWLVAFAGPWPDNSFKPNPFRGSA